MVVLRDDRRIARYKQISQVASILGLLALLAGFVLVFSGAENAFLYQFIGLTVGWLFSQIGLYLAHRYGRSPRPDEVLDQALRKAAPQGRLYHYLLPVPHVLLTPAGPVVIVAKYQSGNISAHGDMWRQSSGGATASSLSRFLAGIRRFFNQEGLGNPTREAENSVKALAAYIHKHAPTVEEVPIGAVIVFTTKDGRNLDVSESRIPAMHYTKLKGFFRQKAQGPALAEADYQALRAAFDKVAKDESAESG